MSAKLLGFAAVAEIMDHERFAMVIRAELETVRNLLGSNMIVISGANTKPELIFLRTCIEFRVPTIVLLKNIDPLLDEENSKLRHSLLSVSLATYLLPSSTPANSILEWADALLCTCGDHEDEMLMDALALGIPTRKLHSINLSANWTLIPQPAHSPRHGFPTRRELLEFLDRRFHH
jgi:hypothetical protein